MQRVREARVEIDGRVVGSIGYGLLVYLGYGRGDDVRTLRAMVDKVSGLRIFPDAAGRMMHDVRDVQGSLLVVSQFTLYGDVQRGRRPGFDGAMPPDEARAFHAMALEAFRATGIPLATGEFQADMQVLASVDGPVTILVPMDREP